MSRRKNKHNLQNISRGYNPQVIPKKKPIDLWLAIGALVVAIVLTLLPKTPFVVVSLLILIFLLMLHPILNFWWIEKTIFRRLVANFLLIIALFFLGYVSWPPSKMSDVSLRFIYPEEPALVIINQSDSIAREIKWTLAIWNMDLPDRNDPLPIPISTFDWLKPHTEGGPQNLFGSPLVAPLIKPGDRLFGSASINCPDCIRGRTYIVYIVYGQSGWFSEIETQTSGGVIVPKKFLRDTRKAYFQELETLIPQQNRIPIANPW